MQKIKVGITGGIGSGKSFVCQILEKKGYPVYYSDDASKFLTNNDPTIKSGLIALVGEDVYGKNGLNKELLAQKIFSDDSIRLAVNQLIHPIVRQHFADFFGNSDSHIVFNEAAILVETGAYKTLDFLVLVTAPLELKMERIRLRDGASDADIEARMAKQLPDEKKAEVADFVIHNDGRPLLEQIVHLIQTIKQKFNLQD